MTHWTDLRLRRIHQRLEALEAALAQQDEPVQEPVAWIQPDHLQKARIAPFLCRVEPTQRCADFVPLYTAPPQRKPLTKEEIMRAFYAAEKTPMSIRHGLSVVEAARIVEKAHGIGEQP